MLLGDKAPPIYRVVTIGDASVGKTSIINKLVHNEFNKNEQTTVGAMFVMHLAQVGNEHVEMQIWDTAGQEKFRALGPIYYRNAHVGIIVIDITSLVSFQHIDEWITNFRKIAGNEALLVVAANKADMQMERQVSDDMLASWSANSGIKWFLTSAFDGTGIADMINFIAQHLMKSSAHGIPVSTPSARPTTTNSDTESSQGCAC